MAPAKPANRRGRSREQVALAGSAYALSRSRSVAISDLSREGAQLDGRDLPLVGEEIVLVAGPLDVMARVAWRTEAKCGVSFEEPVSEATIEAMKRDARWTAVAGWYR